MLDLRPSRRVIETDEGRALGVVAGYTVLLAIRVKLQTVLDYRQTLCNIAQQDLCRTLEEEKDLIARLDRERQDLDNLYADLAKRQQLAAANTAEARWAA